MNRRFDRDDLGTFAWTQGSRIARREQAAAIGALVRAAVARLRSRRRATPRHEGEALRA